jgi:hypothetical protein
MNATSVGGMATSRGLDLINKLDRLAKLHAAAANSDLKAKAEGLKAALMPMPTAISDNFTYKLSELHRRWSPKLSEFLVKYDAFVKAAPRIKSSRVDIARLEAAIEGLYRRNHRALNEPCGESNKQCGQFAIESLNNLAALVKGGGSNRAVLAERLTNIANKINKDKQYRQFKNTQLSSYVDETLRQDLSAVLETNRASSSSTDPLHDKGFAIGAVDYLRYCKESELMRGEFVSLRFDSPDLFEELTVQTIHMHLLEPTMQAIGLLEADVKKTVGKLANTKDNTQRREILLKVSAELIKLRNELMAAANDGRAAITAHTGLKELQSQYTQFGMLGDTVQSSGSTAMSSSFPSAGSAEDAGGGDGAGWNGDILFRHVDDDRLRGHVREVATFLKKKLGSSQFSQAASAQKERLDARITELNDGMATDGAVAAASGKLVAANAYMEGVRQALAAFMTMQASFVPKQHRAAMQYIAYWDSMRATLPSVSTGLIDEHKKLLREVHAKSDELLKSVTDEVQSVAHDRDGLMRRMGDEQVIMLRDRLGALLRRLDEASDRVDRYYGEGSFSALDMLRDPQFLIMLGLKGVRLGLAWAALRVAANVFQGLYNRATYGGAGGDPPSPAMFVGLFMALDAAFNLALFVVLRTLMYFFKNAGNEFPIDGPLLWAWAFDYGVTSALVAVLALIIGGVVSSKKYFRYKYEGDRGIRAMRAMVFYVYCVVLPVPFFRLA